MESIGLAAPRVAVRGQNLRVWLGAAQFRARLDQSRRRGICLQTWSGCSKTMLAGLNASLSGATLRGVLTTKARTLRSGRSRQAAVDLIPRQDSRAIHMRIPVWSGRSPRAAIDLTQRQDIRASQARILVGSGQSLRAAVGRIPQLRSVANSARTCTAGLSGQSLRAACDLILQVACAQVRRSPRGWSGRSPPATWGTRAARRRAKSWPRGAGRPPVAGHPRIARAPKTRSRSVRPREGQLLHDLHGLNRQTICAHPQAPLCF